MNVEQTLTDELRVVADTVGPPPPPAVATLVREARREHARTLRTRLGGTALVAAAVVAAIVIGTQVGRPSASPNPLPRPTELPTSLPTGAPPAITFVKNDKLYVGNQVQPGSWASVVNQQGTSIGYLNDFTRLTGGMVLFRDGSEVVRVPNASIQGAVVSPDGLKVAWAERDGSAWFLVVYDLEARHEQGRLPVDAHVVGHVGQETEAWESLSSVDNTGEVSWGGVLKQHLWTPGSAPRETAPEAPGETGSTAYPVEAGVVSVSPDGTWGAWTIDHSGEQAQGTSEAPDRYTVEVTAQKPDQPASTIHFTLPRNTNASGVTWETDDAFLVTVFDDPTGISWHYVRCLVATGKCEYAPTPESP